eukprot:183351-Rhodomonas_salina.2
MMRIRMLMMMIRVVVVGGDDNGCDTGGGDGEDDDDDDDDDTAAADDDDDRMCSTPNHNPKALHPSTFNSTFDPKPQQTLCPNDQTLNLRT